MCSSIFFEIMLTCKISKSWKAGIFIFLCYLGTKIKRKSFSVDCSVDFYKCLFQSDIHQLVMAWYDDSERIDIDG